MRAFTTVLGGNLDDLAGGWIPAVASFPLLHDQLAHARQHELAGAFELFLRQPHKLLEQVAYGRTFHVEPLCEMREQLHLAHPPGVCHGRGPPGWNKVAGIVAPLVPGVNETRRTGGG